MVAVALPSATVKWVQPSFFWEQQSPIQTAPFLAEFDNDQFMSQFLDMMAGNIPIALNPPKDKVQLADPQTKKAVTTDILKLYQPLHQRYYLVTGSLVCRRFGLPDHTVDRKNKEKVSFVLRRVLQINGQGPLVEYGWVSGPQKGWQPVAANKVLPNEERQPLHPVKIQPPSLSGTPSLKDLRANTVAPTDQRAVYHGYIPVASREKYLTPFASADAAQLIQDEITNLPPDQQPPDPRLGEVSTRVIGAWRAMYVDVRYGDQPPPTGPIVPTTDDIRQQISLNVIVDLGDFLKRNLSSVSNFILHNISLPSGSTQRQALLTELQNIMVITNDPNKPISLADAVKKLSDSANLARAENGSPPDTYNLFEAPPGGKNAGGSYLALPPKEGTFYTLFREALDEEKAAHSNAWLSVPDEIGNMIKDEPIDGDIYWLRLVYEHDPCDPVVSDPSDAFSFAKVFDPDAPARKIRIELPSVKLKDLRKYKRGVGLQFSPELHNIIGRINTDMLNGKDLSPANTGTNLNVAFICSFSIPIITICALIVMFIFLILFNIIFWWLPFIRICFPIPTRKSGG